MTSARSKASRPIRERILFDAGWRFHRGEAPDVTTPPDYAHLRSWILATGTELIGAGSRTKPKRPDSEPAVDAPFSKPDHDDSAWRMLDLPHDWGIEGPFAHDLPGETGKLPWQGVGWYRKRFKLPAACQGRSIFLEIDGAMAFSAVWLNGRLVGGWPYGYTSYRLDLTPYANCGVDNVLAIRLDNPPDSSRWYPGSGLYRHVWLAFEPLVRVAHWGVSVTTPRVTKDEAVVIVDVTLENTGDAPVDIVVRSAVHRLGDDGEVMGRAVSVDADKSVAVLSRLSAHRSNRLRVAKPRLWTLERRDRYVVVTTLEVAGETIDRVETPFGIRTIAFNALDGFHLNGMRVPLQGVCMHHDLGALGAAINLSAMERQLRILREMGCNAIRTSHNPPAPELLELCDRMGFLVMDEAFDCWRRGKKSPSTMSGSDSDVAYCDYAHVFDDWHERDLRALVRRDRNHPCVVLWSIGNEIIEQWHTDGWRLATHLAGIVREEDRTRLVTAGLNNDQAGYIGFQTAIDVVGFNYKPHEYAPFHDRHPTQPVLGSETSSCVSSRGEYFFPVSDDKLEGRCNFQVSSYDLSAASWALIPDDEFKGIDLAPYVAGEFVWTGFDYLGEPTPYNSDATNLLNFSDPVERERVAAELAAIGRIAVPSRSSYFGIVDLAGFPKDRFHLYQARWRPGLRMAHILPHWTWPERVGQVTPVHVYSSGDEAELFLNGRSLGRCKRGALRYRFRWDDVVYEAGELRVVVRRGGRPWATAVQRTAGAPAKVALVADRRRIASDGDELAFITTRICDSRGRLVPRASDRVRYAVRGPGEVIAVDNGDPTSLEPFQATERRAFNGMALAIVRAKRGRSGELKVRAEVDGLAPGEVRIVVFK